MVIVSMGQPDDCWSASMPKIIITIIIIIFVVLS